MTPSQKTRSPRLRYRLALFAAAIPLVYVVFGLRMNNVSDQQATVERIRSLGGRVDLCDTNYAPRWMESMVYPEVRIVSLENAKIDGDDLQAIAKFRSLERLDLTGSEIEPGQFQSLNSLGNLQSLSLARTNIGNEDVQHLAGLPVLKTLSLAQTNVEDVDFLALGSLSSLQNLNISGSRVTAEGLKILDSLNGLMLLELDDRQLTADSAKYLTQLPLNRVIVRIHEGDGKDKRDLLAELQISRAVAMSHKDDVIIWEAGRPWEETVAGACEKVAEVLQLEADQVIELRSILARSGWKSLVLPAGSREQSDSGDPNQIKSFAEFMTAIESPPVENDVNLWAFATSEQSKIIIPELVPLLKEVNYTSTERWAKDRAARLHRFGRYILVRSGLQDKEIVELLSQMLHDPNDNVRAGTIRAFDGVFPRLPDAEQRAANASGAPVALRLLVEASQDSDVQIRVDAMPLIGRIASQYPEHASLVLPAVAQGLIDDNPSCREYALRAWDAIASTNPMAVAPYIEGFEKLIHGGSDAEVTAVLIEALGCVGNTNEELANRAADILLATIGRPDTRLRQSSAAIAMGRLAEDNLNVTKRIVAELLRQYSKDEIPRAKIERAVFYIVSGIVGPKRRIVMGN